MPKRIIPKTIGFLYQNGLKKIFFKKDPETVHDTMMKIGKILGKCKLTKTITRMIFGYEHPSLHQNILGISFKNPIGLSAGFDKNAELTDILPEVGFGFLEVGSITGEPCLGNPKPRLWRLPESESLVVYYGLKNDGCVNIEKRLRSKKCEVPLAVSIAKTNNPNTCDTEKGIADYEKAYTTMGNIGNFDVINISCPNAFGGEPFTEITKLEALLSKINQKRNKKPIFLKISPDLSFDHVDQILDLCQKHKVNGIICSNLTKKRENDKIKENFVPEKGGLSGKVVEELANAQISHIYAKTKGSLVIIGVGGVFSAEDAYKKIRLGASLVSLITGMIYKGPQLIGEINAGLAEMLQRDGYTSIAEARGTLNTP